LNLYIRYFLTEFNDDNGNIAIVPGRYRHWRTVRSTTCTFAARMETIIYFERLNLLPNVLEDYKRSNIITGPQYNAITLSPLPSLASHIENYHHGYQSEYEAYVSLYFNWHKKGTELVEYIKSNLKDVNLWENANKSDVVVIENTVQDDSSTIKSEL
jgi:hypothetical protein